MTSSYVALVAFLVFCVFFALNLSQTHGFSINLITIDRVDKALFPENLALEDRFRRIATISGARIQQLETATSLSLVEWKWIDKHEPYTLQPRLTPHNLGYFVTSLIVGSHSYTPYLIVDTGSDDTWMQCEGCTECFRISQGNFKRSESRSYRPLPCNDTRCYPRICKDGNCMYKGNFYGSGCFDCYSKGAVGLETFGFQDRRGVKMFPNTAFGCGLENHKFCWEKIGESNIIAGVLGLGTGPRSIFWQYRNETKMRMSYCLPPHNSPSGTYTVLRFGDEAQIRGRTWTTRLLPNLNKYAINVIDISVAGTRLRLNPEIFRLKPNLTGGFIIDSGCLQTLLVQTAYNAVKREIMRYFQRNYRWLPKSPGPGDFDLCYNVPGGNYTFPTMTYHFEGANLFLDASNVFQNFDQGFCLIMMPINEGDTSILGSFQQTNHRFLFDFRALTVSFVPEICRYN